MPTGGCEVQAEQAPYLPGYPSGLSSLESAAGCCFLATTPFQHTADPSDKTHIPRPNHWRRILMPP